MHQDKFIVKIKSQYLFCYMRNELISGKMESTKAEMKSLNKEKFLPAAYEKKHRKLSAELSLLVDAMEFPSSRGRHGKSFVIEELYLIDNRIDLKELIDHVLKGSRPIGETYVSILERMIPGCREAYEKGPHNLFEVFYAQSLIHASLSLAESITLALDSIHSGHSRVKDDIRETLRIRGITMIFGGGLMMMDGLDKAINLLFPENDWRECQYPIDISDSNDDIKAIPGIGVQILPVEVAAPILLSYAYIRACYFGEENYMAKICYKAKVLQIMRSKYMLSNEGWFWVDTSVKNETLSLSGMQVRKAFHAIKTFAPIPSFAQAFRLND